MTASREGRIDTVAVYTTSARGETCGFARLACRGPHLRGIVCGVHLNIDALVADLDAAAIRTWERVFHGPAMGMTLREDGITYENLFTLSRAHPALVCRKFTSREEPLNGGDWEWWIGSDDEGWIALRIQAKKLVGMRYDELLYRAASQERAQCRVLVEETERQAEGRAFYPFYCFYNGWDHSAGWPAGVAWTVGCAQPANCPTVPDVRVFGCALADANDVLDVIESSAAPLDAAGVLPLQRPWSWLFSEMGRGNTADLVSIHENVQGQRGARPQGAPLAELPIYASAVRAQWQGDSLREVAQFVPTNYVAVTDLVSLRVGQEPRSELQ